MIETRNTTVTLSGTEKAVEFAAAYNYFYVKNDSPDTVYVSMSPNITAGADGVFAVDAGGSCGTAHGYPATKLYLLGTGSVQVCGTGSADCPFKPASRGGDGKNADKASSYALNGAADYPLMALDLYGKSVQNGTPVPDAPVDIVSVGGSGSVEIKTCGKNLVYHNVNNTNFDGLSVRSNADGSLTVNGTVTKGNWEILLNKVYLIKNHKYYIGLKTDKGGGVSPAANMAFCIQIRYGNYNYARLGEAAIFVWSSDTGYYNLRFATGKNNAGTNVNNMTVYPVFMDNDISDKSFEPYIGSSAAITSSLPLCGIPVASGGNYTDANGQMWVCDELVYNADGTGKIIKSINKVTFDGSSDENWLLNTTASKVSGENSKVRYAFNNKETALKPIGHDRTAAFTLSPRFRSSHYQTKKADQTYNNQTGISIDAAGVILIYDDNKSELSVDEWKSYLSSNPLTVIYQLAEPQEINLTTAEMSALRSLQTFASVTNISNSADAEMSVKYCTNKALAEYVKPLINGLQAQIDTLSAAILSLGGNI